MVQVKIIRNDTKLIERDINQWLVNIGSVHGYAVSIIDIKLYHIPETDVDTVMIIYNRTQLNNQTPI